MPVYFNSDNITVESLVDEAFREAKADHSMEFPGENFSYSTEYEDFGPGKDTYRMNISNGDEETARLKIELSENRGKLLTLRYTSPMAEQETKALLDYMVENIDEITGTVHEDKDRFMDGRYAQWRLEENTGREDKHWGT